MARKHTLYPNNARDGLLLPLVYFNVCTKFLKWNAEKLSIHFVPIKLRWLYNSSFLVLSLPPLIGSNRSTCYWCWQNEEEEEEVKNNNNKLHKIEHIFLEIENLCCAEESRQNCWRNTFLAYLSMLKFDNAIKQLIKMYCIKMRKTNFLLKLIFVD